MICKSCCFVEVIIDVFKKAFFSHWISLNEGHISVMYFYIEILRRNQGIIILFFPKLLYIYESFCSMFSLYYHLHQFINNNDMKILWIMLDLFARYNNLILRYKIIKIFLIK